VPDQYLQGVHYSAERHLHVDCWHVQHHSRAGQGVEPGSSDLGTRTQAQTDSSSQVINAGCYNLINMNGSSICISAPGKQYAAPSASALAPSLASIAALVPTDIAHGTNTDCGMYYQAVTGDYCNLITIKYGISLADFVFLNPAINQNCTNLYEGESYCVVPVGDSKYCSIPPMTKPECTSRHIWLKDGVLWHISTIRHCM